ncbi:MAG: tellurite resistance/C4-dicarboxylate transporter family protein [Actinocatenispora sp.]
MTAHHAGAPGPDHPGADLDDRTGGGGPPAVRVRHRLSPWLRRLDPGYFAFVMATGIVAQAVHLDAEARLSGALLAVAVLAYLLLVAAYAGRATRYRREFLADAMDPAKGFAYLTFVAGTNVLGAELSASGYPAVGAVLLAVAGLAWVVLSYGVPGAVMAHRGARATLAGANGTWFMVVVATQSVAVTAAGLPPSPVLSAVAVTCWSIGVVLYLVVAALVLSSLLLFRARPAEITPAYWVFMGSTAISVLAGARLLGLRPDPLLAAVRPALAGVCVALWAFGTWLIPALIAVGVWRHVVRRVPLRYDPGVWSIVFPIGMYGVASRELGTALRVDWLVTLGAGEGWVAFGVWLAGFTAMVAVALRSLRRTGTGAQPA